MNGRIQYNEAITLLKKEEYPAALHWFNLAYENFTHRTDKANCLFQCAAIYEKTNKDSDAVHYFKRASDLYTNNIARARCEYQQALVYQKNFYENKLLAKKSFDDAIALLPPNVNSDLKVVIYFKYALFCFDLGSQFHFFPTREKRKRNEAHLQNAIHYFNEALICCEKLQPIHLDTKGKILFNRATVYDALGKFQEAHNDLTAAYTLNPNFAGDDFTSLEKIEELVQHYPEFYQNTLKKLLLPEQLKHVKKMLLSKNTLEKFEKVASLLPDDADKNTKLQIYLDCANGYYELARDYFSFSREKRKNNNQNYMKAIQYYNLALPCYESIDNNVEKGEVFFNLACLYHYFDKHQDAQDHFTAAYNTNPKLVRVTATEIWFENFIKNYPEFYRNTFKPLLSDEQKKSAEKVELVIQKADMKKEKFQLFKTKIPLFSVSNNSELKSEEKRLDHGNYFLLLDEPKRKNSRG